MTELKFTHKVTFKRCDKCGKGHDLSAITCSKSRGKDEQKKVKPCNGKLQIIQTDTIYLHKFDTVRNK